ncbi:nacht domain protein [Colletotrichum chrysophilum]|uniref:Nacht domain protein n=1 Tax=Colletotrichum chrysophilum TaxID=1836956 RepID=A0AAD9A9V2_9PEZI|nr:nacht domain protein [Colletotrichum chrysophilum]
MATSNRTQSPRNEGELSLAPLSNALSARSDRPTRLENALNAFRDVLTADEREKLKVEMNISRDPSQVIAFTAGLDLMDPNRRGKSIATRLHSILQTVQQFSQVVDTYVSSNPEIAALVWGSVRLAFTVLANFTSFFQTFSDLLDGFDALTPQFKEYQILFPDSLSLRDSIYDFHTAIIPCCTQVISSTRRTWPQQALAAITRSFESEIGPSIAEIRKRAELVKGQAALAKAQDDSRRRKWSSLLLKLSSYDYELAFSHARGKIHRETAEWIFSTSEFQDWYESIDSRVLNISGKIGSGKTLLTANVISHLLQKAQPASSVSYLFIRFDDDNSRLADTILRCLIYQSLTGREVQDSLKSMLEKSESTGFDRNSLLLLLGHSISLLDKSFLVIDGLDQCSPQEQYILFQSFSQLMHMSNGRGRIKILISGRESTAKEVDRALSPTNHLRTGLADTNADLARYAAEILTQKRDRGQLVLGDESIMDQIVDQLQTGGEGMFLWVFLTIEDICCCPTDRDIRKALEILPRSLSDTFNRALGRIISSQSTSVVDLVQRTFKWVAAVRRPVTRWELGEALGVKILQESSVKDQTINGTERLPSWCENLVHIEAGDETVRFFHHSIKTHLLGTKLKEETSELAAFHVDLKAWDHQVGEVCLTYLNFGDFQRALTKRSAEINSLDVRQIATSNEGRSIPIAISNLATLDALPHAGRQYASRILRRFLKPKQYGEGLQVPKDDSKSEESPKFSGYPFLRYAGDFWLHHTYNFQQSTTKTWKLWKDQLTKSMFADDTFWANLEDRWPDCDTFNLESWRVDQLDQPADLIESRSRNLEAEKVALLHKTIMFAYCIGHKALLIHILKTMKDGGHELRPEILEQLLPTRHCHRFIVEHEGYTQEENPHEDLVSLVSEFAAWGGPMWPPRPDLEWQVWQPQWNITHTEKILYEDLITLLSGSGYSATHRTWLRLFAKMAVLKLRKETSDTHETRSNSDRLCIHEVHTMYGMDIIDTILEIGGSSSFKFARWVSGLHESCVGGHEYTIDGWRSKLQRALRNRNMNSVEFYSQEAKVAMAAEKEDCQSDYDLLNEIGTCRSLRHDLRWKAICIAIPGVTKRDRRKAYDEFKRVIISGDWSIAVASSDHGFKLVSRPSNRPTCLQIFDTIFVCVSQGEDPPCTQGWVTLENKPKATLDLCAHHTYEAEQACGRRYVKGPDDERIFNALHDLVYPIKNSTP